MASPNAFCTGLGAFSASRRTRSRTASGYRHERARIAAAQCVE